MSQSVHQSISQSIGQPISQTLPSLVQEMARLRSGHEFVCQGSKSLSYEAFEREVQACARGLMALGVSRGDHVAILMGNRLEWLIADFAICSIGAVMVGLNTWVTAHELAYLLEHSDTRVLVTSGRFLKYDYLLMLAEIRRLAPAALAGLRHIVLTDENQASTGSLSWSELLDRGRQTPVAQWQAAASAVQPTDVCYLLYTSGSTARPKGVLLQHGPMIENMWHIGQRQHVTTSDRLWLAVSLFWGLGCENALFNIMTHGATLVLQEHFDAQEAIALIDRSRCTLFYGTPNMVTALMATPNFSALGLGQMRGGATIGSPEQIQRLIDAGLHDICNIYGLTETYGNCHVTDAGLPATLRLRSVGQALPGNLAHICNPLGDEELPVGEIGEIRIEGRVLLGYYKDPQATALAFDTNGYFRTGDLGHVDAEGFLFFKGRLKEVIKTSGMNVSPVEVEEVLLSHPEVLTAYCVGIDGMEGEDTMVAAVVVLKPQATLSEKILRDLCVQRLARYKCPKKILFVDEAQIPLTTTGKVKKNEIARLFET